MPKETRSKNKKKISDARKHNKVKSEEKEAFDAQICGLCFHLWSRFRHKLRLPLTLIHIWTSIIVNLFLLLFYQTSSLKHHIFILKPECFQNKF